MIAFEFEEDRIYFEKLLCEGSQHIEEFQNLFDFRPALIKRKEFNRIRNQIKDRLIAEHGIQCMLSLDVCNTDSGLAIDHLIPLSTNQLNKHLRKLNAEKGRKVKTQSLGSNHFDNLLLACNNCNNHKKHRILDKETLTKILIRKRA